MQGKFGLRSTSHARVNDLNDLDIDNEQPFPLRGRFRSDPHFIAAWVEIVPIDDLRPNANAVQVPERQNSLLEEKVNKFGFPNPLIVDENNTILVGRVRWEAARRVGLLQVPVVRLLHLSPAQKTASANADEELAELGALDLDFLANEFEFLTDLDSDITFCGDRLEARRELP